MNECLFFKSRFMFYQLSLYLCCRCVSGVAIGCVLLVVVVVCYELRIGPVFSGFFSLARRAVYGLSTTVCTVHFTTAS
jgi:hypothetical protein